MTVPLISTAQARICVLVSGSGTNLQAVLDACTSGELDAEVVGVISDNPEAKALDRAGNAGVPHVALMPPRRFDQTRRDWDDALGLAVLELRPDFVVLAGFMRLLSSAFLDRFPGRVVNLHPALPGELPGLNSLERAFDEFRAGARSRSGVMVHLVPDEGVDTGPVLGIEEVAFVEHDTFDRFAERMHAAEHRLLVKTLHELISLRSDHAIIG
jgi:phosphoribosylglycinamide formyltransferase 1